MKFGNNINKSLKKFFYILLGLVFIILLIFCPSNNLHPLTIKRDSINFVRLFKLVIPKKEERIKIIIGTYLGSEERNFYGTNPPDKLDVLWTLSIGSGNTRVGRNNFSWSGAGWTGQPLLVIEDKTPYLIHGAFDYNLRKINALTGKEIWRYAFDDIIKGTGSLWYNTNGDSINKYVIMQGSRQGNNLSFVATTVPSFRAVSYLSGKEIWRMNSKLTASYSRDVDASPIVVNDTGYIGLENGIFQVFSPDPKLVNTKENYCYPKLYKDTLLYSKDDQKQHGGNLVTEASPAKLGNRIYIASGSGHIFGYNLKSKTIDWDFYTGSDLDGTPVITDDSCIIVTVEKQYVKGNGGVFKLNPSKPASESVVWYFPTGNCHFFSWQGGVVGSAAINDKSRKNTNESYLSAFTGIDGYLYVVNHCKTDSTKTVFGPDGMTTYYSPELVFKYKTGPSIATPLLIDDKLIVPSYSGIYLFSKDLNNTFELLEYKNIGCIESTPIVYNKRIYISSRNGLLYCLGTKDTISYNNNVLYEAANTSVNFKLNEFYKHFVKEKVALANITKTTEKTKEAKTVIKEAANIKHYKEVVKLLKDSGNYYVIRGSFRSRENAERFVIKLNNSGYSSEIANKRGGLILVSCGNYKYENDAKLLVNKVKNTGGDAWIYKKQ